MQKRWAKPILLFTLILAFQALARLAPVEANGSAQLPTGSLPTVTGTALGPMVKVIPNGSESQANLRSGPNQLFDRVGVLLLGQQVPALGRSPKGEWIEVAYPGAPDGKAWVYTYLVEIEPKDALLPVVEAPPLPTPPAVSTIDPTLAAKFVVTLEPTRLPTFTPPAPLVIPTFIDASETSASSKLPMGLVILGLAALGLFIGLVAFSQR